MKYKKVSIGQILRMKAWMTRMHYILSKQDPIGMLFKNNS